MNKIIEAQKFLRENNIDYWLIVTAENKDLHSSWLLGTKCYSRHAIVIPKEDSPRVIISIMEANMVRKEKKFKKEDVLEYKDSKEFIKLLKSNIESDEKIKIAINYVDEIYERGGETLSFLLYSDFLELKRLFPNATFVSAEELLYSLRAIKNEEEIKNHQIAANIAIEAIEKVIPLIKPGITESEIAAEIEYFMRKKGADIAFNTIVASGKNSADPHHLTKNIAIEKESLIIIDLGAKYNYQVSDMTWTLYLGDNPSSEVKKMYSVVKEAHDRAIESIKPGVEGWQVDRVAREYIYSQGYKEEHFKHSTGHPIGIDVHGIGPILGEKEKSKRTLLKLVPGMIVTVEPGVYVETVGGVRIEDDILVTKDGYRVLTRTPEELITI